MKDQPLVSIIIPTYNRAHLIGETLDSVLVQTYQNWECIIVDDGSSDNTDEVVSEYVKKDSRFKYFHRPDEHLPGGNGARNYGFKMSKGEYVNWFDSDDLMLPEKLEENLTFIKDNNLEFIIDRFEDFENYIKPEMSILNFEKIYVEDYIFHKVFWGTCNMLLNRKLLHDIKFNEQLKSGQEYNFFAKFILYNNFNEAFRLNKTLVYRRIHQNSIQQKQKKSSELKSRNKFNIYWETYNETYKYSTKEMRKFLVYQLLGHYFTLLHQNIVVLKPKEIVIKTRKNKSQTPILISILYFYLYLKLGYKKLRQVYLYFII
jgi:glycosyltransferase involved in cell wall biosynthesis